MKTPGTIGAVVLGAIVAGLLSVAAQPADNGSGVSRYAEQLDNDLVTGKGQARAANVLRRLARSHLLYNPALMGHRPTLTDIAESLPDEIQVDERHFVECVKRNTAQTLLAPLPHLLNEFSNNKDNLGGTGIWAFDLRFIAARGLGRSMSTETSGGWRVSRRRNVLETAYIVRQAAGTTWPIVSFVYQDDLDLVADLVSWTRYVLHVNTTQQHSPTDHDAVRLASVVKLGSVTDWVENRTWSMSVHSEYMTRRLAKKLGPVWSVPSLGAYRWIHTAAGIIAVDAASASNRDSGIMQLDDKLSQMLPYSHLCLGGPPMGPSKASRVRLGVRHVVLGAEHLSIWGDLLFATPPTTHEFSRQLFSHCASGLPSGLPSDSFKFLY